MQSTERAGAARAGLARAWVVAWWLLAALPSWAAPLVMLDASRPEVPLGSAADVWFDPTGQRGADEVATDSSLAWTPSREGAIYPVGAGRSLWLRFAVAQVHQGERWYLEVPHPAVNRVTLFAQDRLGQWTPLSAGDTLPVADWPLPHRHPVLPLALSVREPRQFLLRVDHAQNFSAPLGFTSERELILQEQRTSLVLGVYFGLATLALVLAVAAAASLRDSAFARFALAVLLMGLTQASLNGVAGLHLWPRQAWWNDVASGVLPVLAVGALLWCFSAMISLRQRSYRLHGLLMALAALSVPVACALLVVDAPLRIRFTAPYIATGLAAGLAIIAWAWRRGEQLAGWLLVGFTPLAVAACFPLARALGWIAANFWTAHAMKIGLAVELPVMLTVLMLRSQHRRENSRRIQGLDRMDPATGLINADVFQDQLARMMARSERLKYRSAVLLVDVVNLEQIARDFGPREAEQIPLRVAGRLLSAAREIDVVGRLSERRFGMLVEGPLSPEEAAAAGPKVVARCLMPFQGKPLECVPQVRVVQTLVPGSQPAEQVTARLAAVLAAVPAGSKRAVFNIH